MTDRILLRGVRLPVRVGVTDEERAEVRDVTIDVEIAGELSVAGASDDLADTIDYAEVVARMERLVAGGEFRLLEAIAERIASEIVALDGVARVTVEVGKRPPIPQEVDAVAVRIDRSP